MSDRPQLRWRMQFVNWGSWHHNRRNNMRARSRWGWPLWRKVTITHHFQTSLSESPEDDGVTVDMWDKTAEHLLQETASPVIILGSFSKVPNDTRITFPSAFFVLCNLPGTFGFEVGAPLKFCLLLENTVRWARVKINQQCRRARSKQHHQQSNISHYMIRNDVFCKLNTLQCQIL